MPFGQQTHDGVGGLGHHLVDARHATVLKRVRAARAEDGATLLGDALHLVTGQRHDVRLQHATPAAAEADELVTVLGRAC